MILLLGCAKRIVSLVLLVALAAAAWYYRGDIKALWQRFRGTTPVATTEAPEAAGRSAHKKFQALIGRHPPARTALSQAEANALAQQLIAPFLPQWVDSPRIELEGDQIRLSARVPANRIPQVKELGQVAGLLPDTPEVSVKGQLVPSAAGGTALAVDQVTAAHIPVPRRLLAAVVRSLKKRGDPNPPDQLGLPLMHSVTSAYVRNDSLILLSEGASTGGPR